MIVPLLAPGLRMGTGGLVLPIPAAPPIVKLVIAPPDAIDEDTLRAIRLLWIRATPLAVADAIDQDTLQAIRRIWLSPPSLTAGEAIDEDTLRAVRQLWRAA